MSSKTKMVIFGLCSTSDDWPSDQQKLTEMQKKPPKSSKNGMLGFGLHSTFDDQPSNLSKKCQPKCKTKK